MLNNEAADDGAANDESINMVLGDVFDEVEAETSRMGTMISDLLLIAQADSGVLQIQHEPVEMDTLVLDIYRQAHRIADRQKGTGALEIRLGSEDQALVLGDRELASASPQSSRQCHQVYVGRRRHYGRA